MDKETHRKLRVELSGDQVVTTLLFPLQQLQVTLEELRAEICSLSWLVI